MTIKYLHRSQDWISFRIHVEALAHGNNLSHKLALCFIKYWFLALNVGDSREELWKDDAAFLASKDDPIKFESYVQELRAQKVCRQLLDIGSSKEELQAFPKGLASLLKKGFNHQ